MAAEAISLQSLGHGIVPCKGWDDWGHRVFLVSNEKDQSVTLRTMAERRLVGNTMMGVSGFFLLDVAAIRGILSGENREIEHIVLFDRSLRMEHFWGEMKEVVTSSKSRIEVIEKTKRLLRDNKEWYYKGSCYDPSIPCERFIQLFEQDIEIRNSWLSDDVKFMKIKRIFDNNHFTFLRLDPTDPRGFDGLKRQFQERNMTVDTIYLSNIMEYISTQEEIDACIQSMTGLIDRETLVIDTYPRACVCCESLRQRLLVLWFLPISRLFSLRLSLICSVKCAKNLSKILNRETC